MMPGTDAPLSYADLLAQMQPRSIASEEEAEQIQRQIDTLLDRPERTADELENSVSLYRPTGPKELQLVAESGYRTWPPRLAWQPIFYPVLNEEYATQIARDWNAKDSSTGYRGFVTRFRERQDFLARYEVHRVGGYVHDEYWIPAEDLDELNRNMVGLIEVIAEYAGGPDHNPYQVR
jgi:hypothetical protein